MFIVMKAQRIGFTNGIIASVSYGTNPLFSLPMIFLIKVSGFIITFCIILIF